MDHSLINPNKIPIMVSPVSDEPFDENQNLGVAKKKVLIPFKTNITTVYFYSRVPTRREIMECNHNIMTGET